MPDNKKILIVDDDPDIITYLETLLIDNGYDVVSAPNGKEAFEKAKTIKPDLITLDITMPEESGVRAFRDLQEEPLTTNIPVIIITGVSTEFKKFIETRKNLKPPAAYFPKPINKNELITKVKEIIG
jgi:CheY-like chemotaxis protein